MRKNSFGGEFTLGGGAQDRSYTLGYAALLFPPPQYLFNGSPSFYSSRGDEKSALTCADNYRTDFISSSPESFPALVPALRCSNCSKRRIWSYLIWSRCPLAKILSQLHTVIIWAFEQRQRTFSFMGTLTWDVHILKRCTRDCSGCPLQSASCLHPGPLWLSSEGLHSQPSLKRGTATWLSRARGGRHGSVWVLTTLQVTAKLLWIRGHPAGSHS